MSYILDALKKAEEERRRGTAPDVTAVQDTGAVKASSARSMWIYLMLAALLLNAAVLTWWLGPWNAKRPVGTVPKERGERLMTERETVKEAFDPGAPITGLPAKKAGSAKDSVDRSGNKMPPSKDVKTISRKSSRSQPGENAVKGSVTVKPEAAPGTKGESEASSAPSQPPAGSAIYAMNELPSSVLQGLPDLRMSLHYYTDDPSSRLIRINGANLREGQEVSPGLRLEKITAGGAVFDYRHYRFQIGMHPK